MRKLLSRLVGQMDMWRNVIAGRGYDMGIEAHESVAQIRARLDVAGPAFLAEVRRVVEGGRLDETFIDALCEPDRGLHVRRAHRPRADVRCAPPAPRPRRARIRRASPTSATATRACGSPRAGSSGRRQPSALEERGPASGPRSPAGLPRSTPRADAHRVGPARRPSVVVGPHAVAIRLPGGCGGIGERRDVGGNRSDEHEGPLAAASTLHAETQLVARRCRSTSVAPERRTAPERPARLGPVAGWLPHHSASAGWLAVRSGRMPNPRSGRHR